MKYGWIFVVFFFKKKCSSWALNSKASLLKHLVRYVMPLHSTQCEIREYKLCYQSVKDYNAYSEKWSDSACHGLCRLVCFIFYFFGFIISYFMVLISSDEYCIWSWISLQYFNNAAPWVDEIFFFLSGESFCLSILSIFQESVSWTLDWSLKFARNSLLLWIVELPISRELGESDQSEWPGKAHIQPIPRVIKLQWLNG